MKNSLLAIIKSRKQLMDSNKVYEAALETLYDISSADTFDYDEIDVKEGSITLLSGDLISWRFSREQIIPPPPDIDPYFYTLWVKNISTNRTYIIGVHGWQSFDLDTYIFDNITFKDIIIAYSNSMNVNSALIDMATSYLYSESLSISQVQGIVGKYNASVLGNDLQELTSLLSVVGSTVSSTTFVSVLTELYSQTVNSYEKVQNEETNLFQLDTSKVVVQSFNVLGLAQVFSSVLTFAAAALFVAHPVLAILLTLTGGVINALFHDAAQEEFEVMPESINDFFETPIISDVIYENDVQLPGHANPGLQDKDMVTANFYDNNTNFITYRWRGKDMLSYINTFGIASINFNALRNKWTEEVSGWFISHGTPREARPNNPNVPDAGASRGVIFNNRNIDRLSETFQYNHEQLTALSSNELAAIYAFSIWSVLMKLTSDTGDNDEYAHMKWIYIGDTNYVSADSVLNTSVTGNAFKYMISGLTNIVYNTLNYEGTACNFDYAAVRIGYIASCYAFLVDRFFAGCPRSSAIEGVSPISVYGLKQSIATNSPYLAPAFPTTEANLSDPLYGIYRANFADIFPFVANGTRIQYNSDATSFSYVDVDSTMYEVDTVSPNRTFYIPRYRPYALLTSLVLASLATLTVGLAARMVKLKVSSFIAKRRYRARNNILDLKHVYDDDPNNYNWNKYYRATRRYNFFARIFGWAGFDATTGVSIPAVYQYQDNDSLSELRKQNNNIIDLIKG